MTSTIFEYVAALMLLINAASDVLIFASCIVIILMLAICIYLLADIRSKQKSSIQKTDFQRRFDSLTEEEKEGLLDAAQNYGVSNAGGLFVCIASILLIALSAWTLEDSGSVRGVTFGAIVIIASLFHMFWGEYSFTDNKKTEFLEFVHDHELANSKKHGVLTYQNKLSKYVMRERY